MTTSPKGGNQSGNWFDSGVFEEAAITSVGNPAEAPNRGIQVAIVIKSGGNDFHGGGSLIQSSQGMQGDNIDDELRAQGITSGNPIAVRWDRSAELGGRVVRNKLWFYVQARARRDDRVSLGGFNPDGSPSISKQIQKFSTIKVSNQITPSSKVLGFYQHLGQTGDGSATQFAANAPGDFVPVHTGKVEWQIAKSNSSYRSSMGSELHLDATRARQRCDHRSADRSDHGHERGVDDQSTRPARGSRS